MGSHDLFLVGASVRAAAFSALRAGLQPWCIDLFGDRDLQARCPTTVIPFDRYPHGLLDLAEHAPLGPWTYTGALENRRRLVRHLARRRPLWGNDAPALAFIRSPRRVHAALSSAGLPCPLVRRVSAPPVAGRWLCKPKAGASGVGIHFWDGRPLSPRRAARVYLQEFIEGESCSALFVADARTASLLGVTRQLIGESWLGARPFCYCGSIGPLPLPAETFTLLQHMGETLTQAAGLRGLFGIDFILREGVPWLVEVNPRYTASVEVLEYATGVRALALHRRVFASDSSPEAGLPPPSADLVGKAILFARESLSFPTDGPWMHSLHSPVPVEEMPAFADIPSAGELIEAGRPVLTFFARSATEELCRAELRRMASDLDTWLFGR